MKTAQTSQAGNFPARNYFRRLTGLLLVLLFALAAWQSPLPTADAQTSGGFRFTESLKFQEISPGIEHGQISSGHASEDELTGPWFINALRIDLVRAKLKIVHALDEGVGLETVSSMATRYRAIAATNGGYFRTTGTFRGDSIGLLVLERHLISEPNNLLLELGAVEAINLDGGGSTTMVVRDKLCKSPFRPSR